ncbi:MAG: hypothetical protein LBG58_06935 [Planctomycetaceae bacterium]|nr:hypothetical protein [Planctomycetaceae bacterium]
MMLRKLMNWLDSWDDWINPITLCELRCEISRSSFESIVLSFWLATIVGYVVFFYNIPENLSPKELALQFYVIPAGMSVSSILLSVSTFSSIIRSRYIDELLGIVPLSPRQQVHGYWAFVCIWSIFWNSIFLPVIAFAQLIGPVPYILLLIPFGSVFLSQIMILICLSFAARIKRYWEIILSVLTVFFFYPGLLFFLWKEVVVFVVQNYQPFVWNCGFGFVSLFILLPVMLLLHGYIAYKLSVYGFRTWRKPFWHSLLLNIAVYILFNVISMAIWLAIAAAVIYF